jgi:hypothetical protein
MMGIPAVKRRLRRFAVLAGAAAALALPIAALGGAQVPFEAADAGSWGVGTHDCGSQLPVFVGTTGTGTYLGRYTYASQECADLGAATFAGTFTITAANGDTLSGTYAGTFTVDAAGTIHYEQTNTITGGTGRFAGASGSFQVSGLAYSDGRDLQRASGWISSVGASKH